MARREKVHNLRPLTDDQVKYLSDLGQRAGSDQLASEPTAAWWSFYYDIDPGGVDWRSPYASFEPKAFVKLFTRLQEAMAAAREDHDKIFEMMRQGVWPPGQPTVITRGVDPFRLPEWLEWWQAENAFRRGYQGIWDEHAVSALEAEIKRIITRDKTFHPSKMRQLAKSWSADPAISQFFTDLADAFEAGSAPAFGKLSQLMATLGDYRDKVYAQFSPYYVPERARGGGGFLGLRGVGAGVNRTTILREGEACGVPYQIILHSEYAGYRWRVRQPVDHFGGWRWHESGGAFYDTEPDHPEGGVQWAEDSVRRFLCKEVGDDPRGVGAVGGSADEDEEPQPQDDDAFLEPCGHLGSSLCLRIGIGRRAYKETFRGDDQWQDAMIAVAAWAKKNNYWPSLWFIDDHGGVRPVDYASGEGADVSLDGLGAMAALRAGGGTYRTFIRRARNWEEFARAKKRTVDRGLSYDAARRACEAFNRDRTAAQVRKGEKMEFEGE